MNNYSVNKKITVIHQTQYAKSGLVDLIFYLTDPNNETTELNFVEIGEGYYKTEFIPDLVGIWIAKISSASWSGDSVNIYNVVNTFSEDGKQIVRQESRPIGNTTIFTGAGDSVGGIGEGKLLEWDFSNENDTISAPEGYKRKRINFNFLDEVYLKDGTIYFYNALKSSYLDFWIVCPVGCYYYDNLGNVKVATEDTKVIHYVIKHRIQGDCPMGDELNTESCSQAIPTCYKFCMEVTVPDNDILSNGHVDIEMYRKRSIIL